MVCAGSIDGKVMLCEPGTIVFVVVIDVIFAVATATNPDIRVLASSKRDTRWKNMALMWFGLLEFVSVGADAISRQLNAFAVCNYREYRKKE
jgi:hypothetical protein